MDDTDINSIEEAFKILELAFGNTRDTWRAVVKEFEENCSKPDNWNKEASIEKLQLIFKVLEFLNKALSCSKAYPDLEREIINGNTAGAVYKFCKRV